MKYFFTLISFFIFLACTNTKLAIKQEIEIPTTPFVSYVQDSSITVVKTTDSCGSYFKIVRFVIP
jgi:hypothetical protein